MTWESAKEVAWDSGLHGERFSGLANLGGVTRHVRAHERNPFVHAQGTEDPVRRRDSRQVQTVAFHHGRLELSPRGVELTEEPTERPYGTDFGLRDPFGNAIRIVQFTA